MIELCCSYGAARNMEGRGCVQGTACFREGTGCEERTEGIHACECKNEPEGSRRTRGMGTEEGQR